MKFTCLITYNQTKKILLFRDFNVEDKYVRIAYQIESELRRMRAEGVRKLPTEEELCGTYSCSRQTIRSALEMLVDKGLIVKKRGSGSYISDDTNKLQNTIVFITDNKYEYVNPDFICQLKQALKKNRFELICFDTKSSFTKEKETFEKVLSICPAAVIIEPVSNIQPNPNLSLIEDMNNKGIPVIYLYSAYPSPTGAICIEEDDRKGAMKLVSHLKEKGHDKTGCIFRCDDSRGLARYKGYIEACKEFGMRFDEHNAFFYTIRDRKKLISGDDEMLIRFISEKDPECTAVVCQNDAVAFRLIRVLEKRGISVPKDMAVVSFENSYYSKGSADITSLGHSEKELALLTADAVIAAIEHKIMRPEPVKWNLHIRTSG